MKPLVILPTYNERDNLEAIVAAVRAALPAAHCLIVDDASPDGTGALADELAAAAPEVFALHRTGKLGLGTAYIAGFRWALARDYDRVFQMDSDFSHEPASLRDLLAATTGGADVAIGSRYVPGGATENWSRAREALSRAGGIYARLVLGFGIRDPTSGFKCFTRSALQTLPWDRVRAEGYAFQIEVNYLAVRHGLRVVEVPITFRERRAGQSKMSGGIMLEALALLWRIRWTHR